MYMFPLLAKITILSDAHNPAARSTPGGQQLCIVAELGEHDGFA